MISFTMPVWLLDRDCAAWIVQQAHARSLGRLYFIQWT